MSLISILRNKETRGKRTLSFQERAGGMEQEYVIEFENFIARKNF
jgi:hypothetical protein